MIFFSISLGGSVRKIEEKLERPLLYDICAIHSHERPFVDYFKFCDGQGVIHKTTSPVYTGHIGIHFKNKLDLKPIVNFTPINNGRVQVYSQDFLDSLNNDGRYLHQITLAVQRGPANFPPNLVKKCIGKVHSAR